MYLFRQKLQNNINLKIKENQKTLRKSLKCLELMTSTQPAMQRANFGSSSRKLGKTSGKTLFKKTYCTQFFHNILSNIVGSKTFLLFLTRHRPIEIYILYMLVFQKINLILKLIFRATEYLVYFQNQLLWILASSTNLGLKIIPLVAGGQYLLLVFSSIFKEVKTKRNIFNKILDKIFVDTFRFQHNFLSPHVKRDQIIITKT